MRAIILSILLIFVLSGSSAQTSLPVYHELWISYDRLILQNEIPVFTALKPIPNLLYFSRIYKDSASNGSVSRKDKKWLYRKLFLEDLVDHKSDEFSIRLNPVLSFDAGHDNNLNKFVYRNTRGIQIDGNAGQSVTFTSAFYENQAVFPQYLSAKVNADHVIPGQGLPKFLKNNTYDFAWAEGNLSILATKELLLELGYGKRFFGDGYRSLLLSDYSFVYPYVGYRWTSGRFFISSEVHSYVQTLNLAMFDSERFPSKTSTLHFLGYNWDHLQLSFMESNMYANPDSLGKFRWQAEFLNPLPFLNSIANNGNNLFGINLKFNFQKSMQFYGQLLLHQIDWKRLSAWTSVKNKTGFQLGTKFFDVFSIENLYLQLEYNQVRPYAYTAENPIESFSHYNAPLAHPLGANFKEFLTIFNYKRDRLVFDAHFVYAVTGLDNKNSNWGSNIFLNDHTAQFGFPSYGNLIGQGIRNELVNSSFKISWIINPKSTLNLSLGCQNHSQSSSQAKSTTNYFFISLRTSLNNLYYDF